MPLTKESSISEGDRFFDSLALAPNPSSFGIGPAWIGGEEYWSDGITWRLASSSGAISSITYNPDGTVSSITEDGISYSITYNSGKVSTIVGGGVTETYNYDVNGRLVSVTII